VTKNTKKGKAKGETRPSKKSEILQPEDMAAAATITAEAGEIGKIRNILFGTQMADYDKRFSQLEERITTQIAALDDKTAKRLEAIENLIKKQDDALTGRLDKEQSERSHGAEALSGKIAETKQDLSTAIEALGARQAQELDALDKQLTLISNDLSDEIHIQQVEASKNLDRAVQELDDAKLARKALSQLLVEMAGRLTNGSE
jgi:hypothetical protein